MSDLQTVLSAAVLWLDFAGFTTLIGAPAFGYLIIRPALPSPQEFQRFEEPLRRVEAGAIVLVALASVLELLLRALMMGGGILSSVGDTLPLVFSQTRYGPIWIARIGLVGMLGLSWWFWPGSTWSAGARLLGASAVALTRSLSGHAADWGDVTLPVLIDWLHLLAVSTWLGSLLIFGFVLLAVLVQVGNGDAARGFASITWRFSRMAAFCVIVVLTTGLFHPRLRLMSFSTLFSTPYGWTLVAKLSLVLLVLMLAALTRYYFLPLLSDRSGRRVLWTVRTIGRLEWLVAVGVLAASALLTQFTPTRHVSRHGHHEPHAVHLPPGGQAPASSAGRP